MRPLGLYLHIPFCRTRCRYCDFYRVGENQDRMIAFLQALHREIEGLESFHGRPVDSVFFGGGTPSLLLPEQVGEVLEHLDRRFALDHQCEVSLEANPSDLDAERLEALGRCSVNRLSLGVQSFNDRELALLGRRHDAEGALRAVEWARRAGFDNLSLDLMLAIPGQTEAGFRRTLERTVTLAPEHVSLYLLEVHPRSEMDSMRRARPGLFPGEEGQRRRYLGAVASLEQAGLAQYEISNFSRPARACRHNLKYWRCENYLGLGPAAHSHVDGRRWRHVPHLEAYLERPLEREELAADRQLERMFLGLRLAEGVAELELAGVTGSDGAALEARLAELGCLVERADGRVRLTPEGFVVSNSVIGEVLAVGQ
jgi:putative oxygen-independent coproporphyrinogen III oxidase